MVNSEGRGADSGKILEQWIDGDDIVHTRFTSGAYIAVHKNTYKLGPMIMEKVREVMCGNSKIMELQEAGTTYPEYITEESIQYETYMGSHAYGCASETSDYDIYGFCIPPKEVLYQHLKVEIPDFDLPLPKFTEIQRQHLFLEGKEYDFHLYNITTYFKLCSDNNPNMVDSLFTYDDSVIRATKIGKYVREHRKEFLSKKCFYTFGSYAFAQMNDLVNRNYNGKRKELSEKLGYDPKNAYHIVRLLLESFQILEHGDIDLREHKDLLISIRNGEWSDYRIADWFALKDKEHKKLFESSKVQEYCDKKKIRSILKDCLEEYYGSL